jgi:Tol biopolymer transport system component
MKFCVVILFLFLSTVINAQVVDNRIAYILWQDTISSQNSIRLMNLEGTGDIELVNYPGSNWMVYARGHQLWYTTGKDTAGIKRGLYRYDFASKQVTYLFDCKGLYQDIDFDPGSGLFAGGFSHKPEDRSKVQYDIFLFNDNGSIKRPVTNDTAIDLEPVFVPGTDRIIFRSNRDLNPVSWGEFEIYSIRTNGTDLKRLTFNTDSTRNVLKASSPFLSPDGRIVFTGYRHGTYRLMIMNQDGSDLKPLIPMDDMEQTSCSFSPDGKLIVFTGRVKGKRNNDLYLVNKDGSGLRQLTNDWRRKVQPFFIQTN